MPRKPATKGRGPNGLCRICQFETANPGLLSGRLARGATFHEVALEFGLNRESVRRHWCLHVGSEEQRRKIHRRALKLAAEIDPAKIAADSTVVPLEICDHQISDWRRDVREARQRADRTALELADRHLLRWVRARSDVTRDLRRQYTPGTQVNIQQNFAGDIESTISRITGVLARFPEARAAVLQALNMPAPASLMIEAQADD